MQRPLIALAIGAGLATPTAFAAFALVSLDPGWAGTLALKKSVSLTLSAYPRTSQAANALLKDRSAPRAAGTLPLQLSMRLQHDAPAAIMPASAERFAPTDFPTPSIPLVEPAQAALLDQTRFWISERRDDLAELALTKLLRITPDDLPGLELLARIQLRRQSPEAVRKTVERMRSLKPYAPQIGRIDALLRVDGDDRKALQEIRQLARNGRQAEAAAAMRALYPDGPPSEEMTLEYWNMVASAPNGRARAIAGLQALARSEPGNLRFRLALAELLTSRAPVDRAALAQLIELTEVPAYAKQARAAWRRAMLALDGSNASIGLLRFYLAQDSQDTAVQERLQQTIVDVEARRKLLADPNYEAQVSGLGLLAAGKPDAAAPPLQRAYAARPDDIELINGLGLLRLRQRRHDESEALFLRAARLDPARQARWQRMAGVARYWGLLAQAERDVAAGNSALAEQHLRQARAIDPREPAAILALAALFDAQHRSIDAVRSYREVLAQEPGNATALNDLIGLCLRAGQNDQAQQLMAQLPAAQRQALMTALNRDQAGRLRTQADALVAQGRNDEAINLLQQAAALDATDPWLRFDLARLYVKHNGSGDTARADSLFADLISAPAPQAAALYAAALFEDSRDRPLQALIDLERIPVPEREAKLVDLQRRLWLSARIERARQLAQAGQTAAARSLLETAATMVGNDAALVPQLADALAGLGARDSARNLFDRVEGDQRQSPRSTQWYLRRAESAARFEDDAGFNRALEKVTARAPLTASDAARLAALRNDMLARQVDALIAAKQPTAALALLDRQTEPATFERRFVLLRADTLLAAGRSSEAETLFRTVLQRDPADRAAGIGLIDSLIASGQVSRARSELQRQAAEPPAPDTAATLASRWIDLQDDAAALALIDTALNTEPGNPRLLEQAADIAQRGNQPDLAIRYLQRATGARQTAQSAVHARMTLSAPDSTPTADILEKAGAAPVASPGNPSTTALPAPATLEPALYSMQIQSVLPANDVPAGGRPDSSYRKLADLLENRSRWIAGAVDTRTRSGSAGTSQYRSVEVPLEYRQPWREGSRVFAQAIAVDIGADTLNLADTGAASRFGSLLLCQPLCSIGGVSQHVRGLMLDVGIERGEWRADIGTTPLGFPIQNIVGGVVKKGDLGKFSYSIDASRRALTGSVLSYAGARDPNTGALWGGVLANGVRLGLSRDDGGALGAWTALGLHRLTGRNVHANDRVQLMGGTYWRIINNDDRLLTVGANAMAWRFSENAGEYTFGHGGYYSPQRFASLALPVTFSQRTARLSWSLRAALSISRSATAGADYFSTRPDLQAQAEALTATNGVDPRYTASTGRGIGRSLAAAFEYQFNPALFLGGRFEIDRSTDYAPNRLLFYFRYNLDRASARPVTFPPEPLLPASQF